MFVCLFIYFKITRIRAHGYGGVGLVPNRVPKDDALLAVPGGDDVEHLPLYHALARARAQTLHNHALLQHRDLHADVPGGEGADLVLLPLYHALARVRAQTLHNHALLQHRDLHADVPGGEGADLVLLPLHLVLAHSLAHARLRSLSLAHAL